MPGRRARTEGRLELVRAQCLHGREAEMQQHRQTDHPAAAGDGIHEPRRQPGGEEDRVQPERHARTVTQEAGTPQCSP